MHIRISQIHNYFEALMICVHGEIRIHVRDTHYSGAGSHITVTGAYTKIRLHTIIETYHLLLNQAMCTPSYIYEVNLDTGTSQHSPELLQAEAIVDLIYM